VSQSSLRDLTQEVSRLASAVRDSDVPPGRSQLEEVIRVAGQLAAMWRTADDVKAATACRLANSLVTGCQGLLDDVQETDLTDPAAVDALMVDVFNVLDHDLGDLNRLFPSA
jgi:hypothetical protein